MRPSPLPDPLAWPRAQVAMAHPRGYPGRESIPTGRSSGVQGGSPRGRGARRGGGGSREGRDELPPHVELQVPAACPNPGTDRAHNRSFRRVSSRNDCDELLPLLQLAHKTPPTRRRCGKRSHLLTFGRRAMFPVGGGDAGPGARQEDCRAADEWSFRRRSVLGWVGRHREKT